MACVLGLIPVVLRSGGWPGQLCWCRLAPGGSVDLAEQSAELLDRVLCDDHEIVGGLRPCECEHV